MSEFGFFVDSGKDGAIYLVGTMFAIILLLVFFSGMERYKIFGKFFKSLRKIDANVPKKDAKKVFDYMSRRFGGNDSCFLFFTEPIIAEKAAKETGACMEVARKIGRGDGEAYVEIVRNEFVEKKGRDNPDATEEDPEMKLS